MPKIKVKMVDLERYETAAFSIEDHSDRRQRLILFARFRGKHKYKAVWLMNRDIGTPFVFLGRRRVLTALAILRKANPKATYKIVEVLA